MNYERNQPNPHQFLNIHWTEGRWTPQWVHRTPASCTPPVRRGALSLFPVPRGRSRTSRRLVFPGMRTRAFTLIELLVVIAIIGTLAGMLIPAVSGMKKKGKIKQAEKEVAELVAAIAQYQATYSRFPTTAAAGQVDATFGLEPQRNKNAEVVTILRDVDVAGPDGTRFNPSSVRNPQKQNFLSAVRPAIDDTRCAVDTTGVYRDPWGQPYVISFDLNYNGRTKDAIYGDERTESNGSDPAGLTGLSRDPKEPTGFSLVGEVMVWSYGPDKIYEEGVKATAGGNADNILSWRR